MPDTVQAPAASADLHHQTHPAQNLEAEESLLGALMLVKPTSGLFDTIADTGLSPADFYRPSHGLVYRTIVELHDQGEPTDVIVLAETLERTGRLDKIEGGKQRIHELAQIVPATATAPRWAEIVVDNARRREVANVVLRIQAIAQANGAPPGELVEQMRAILDETTRRETKKLEVLTLEQFTSTTEDVTEPLIGTTDDMLLPADGLLLMYGDGGAGKTTLSIDALVHTAAGTPWLTNTIARPQRCILIENEGPRGPFRRLLQRKRDTWQGRSFHDNVHVLEEPWARFTLDDTACRRGLATEIDRTATDLVMIGPLASLGAKGTGTPDDVNVFADLIADLRYRTSRPFALWIIHHENKAGDISGAWERLPDTLLHVSAQGNGRTRLGYRKARWSSRLHDTAATLAWADNAGFELIPDKAERDLETEISALLEEHEVLSTNKIRKALKISPDAAKAALQASSLFREEQTAKGLNWRRTTSLDASVKSVKWAQNSLTDVFTDHLTSVGGEGEGSEADVFTSPPVKSHDEDERRRWIDADA